MSSRSRHLEIAVFAVLVALAAVPLFAGRYLPFFDYPAHLTVPAALRHRADPSTDVANLWAISPGLKPNSLHYVFCYVLSFFISIEEASRIFLALFCVAALPPAMAFLLHTFGRDWRLAVLAIPLTWNRGLWYGFIGFCAALPIALVLLSLVERDLKQPSLRREVCIGLVAALLPFAHFFIMGVTTLLCGALLAVHVVTERRSFTRCLRAAGPVFAGPLVMAAWFIGEMRHSPQPSGGGGIAHLIASRPALREYPRLLRHWFMDGYTGHVDEVVAVLMVLSLAAVVARGMRAKAQVEAEGAARIAPLVLAGILVAMYVALPFETRVPFHWWAMNVRVIPFAFAMLIATPGPGRLDRLGRLLLVPVALASAVYFVGIAVDIRRSFNGSDGMGGFHEVISRLPRGARLLGVYTDYRQLPHYAHYPFMYASSYAVVHGGGLALPFEAIPQSWTNPRVVFPHPFAGDAAYFRFELHMAAVSHVLVRGCVGDRCLADPLENDRRVRLLAERGRWRVYEKCSSGTC